MVPLSSKVRKEGVKGGGEKYSTEYRGRVKSFLSQHNVHKLWPLIVQWAEARRGGNRRFGWHRRGAAHGGHHPGDELVCIQVAYCSPWLYGRRTILYVAIFTIVWLCMKYTSSYSMFVYPGSPGLPKFLCELRKLPKKSFLIPYTPNRLIMNVLSTYTVYYHNIVVILGNQSIYSFFVVWTLWKKMTMTRRRWHKHSKMTSRK